MKTLIFLFFIVVVIGGIFWHIKESRVKAELAQRKSRDLIRNQQKEAMTQDYEMIWPVILRPTKNQDGSGADSQSVPGEEEKVVEEPSMTSIEYTPPKKQSG
jgi:hypothetical protein